MRMLTIGYKYKVLQRLLKTKESFENACSKSGLSISLATKHLIKQKKIQFKQNI
jgi:hypothetical protein